MLWCSTICLWVSLTLVSEFLTDGHFHVSVFTNRYQHAQHLAHSKHSRPFIKKKRSREREKERGEGRNVDGGRMGREGEKKGETENLRIPMFFWNPIKTGKHDGKDDIGVFFYQTHDVFIIPIIQGPFCHLWKKKRKIILRERKRLIKQNQKSLQTKIIWRLFFISFNQMWS